MNTRPVTPVPVARQVTVAPSAFDLFLAAETAAWDEYEADLAVAQEMQDTLVAAGSSVLKAYDAMQWRRYRALHALEAALAAARAEYESATQVPKALPIHQVTGLLEFQHGLTVKYYKRDYPRVITIVADDAARLFADSDPATQVACYPDGRTVYSVAVEGWTVRFVRFDADLPPAKVNADLPPAKVNADLPPAKVNADNVDVDAMSLSELEATMLAAPCGDEFDFFFDAWQARLELLKDDARVVTGDDGLDHYL